MSADDDIDEEELRDELLTQYKGMLQFRRWPDALEMLRDALVQAEHRLDDIASMIEEKPNYTPDPGFLRISAARCRAALEAAKHIRDGT